MASAMRKMAVYLGLVEDDHRYQDKYDSYGEYEDYDDQVDRPDQVEETEVRVVGRDGDLGGGYAGYQAPDWRTDWQRIPMLVIVKGRVELTDHAHHSDHRVVVRKVEAAIDSG